MFELLVKMAQEKSTLVKHFFTLLQPTATRPRTFGSGSRCEDTLASWRMGERVAGRVLAGRVLVGTRASKSDGNCEIRQSDSVRDCQQETTRAHSRRKIPSPPPSPPRRPGMSNGSGGSLAGGSRCLLPHRRRSAAASVHSHSTLALGSIVRCVGWGGEE